MQAVLDRARERAFPGVRWLQSAFHSRSLSLYTKLGFDAREPMSIMQGQPIKKTAEGCAVRRAQPGDVERANRICESVHGHNRAGELRNAVGQGSAVVDERHGRITGYASSLAFFGHAVGESAVDPESWCHPQRATLPLVAGERAACGLSHDAHEHRALQ
jgi:hypothetical protein